MNKKHKVWSLVNFDKELDYINNVLFITKSENITLTDYIERIYDNMEYKVENGYGCAVDSILNDMTNIIAMVDGNSGITVHTPFLNCKFIYNMNSEEVNIVRFVDENINEILGYVAGAFRENFCKKANMVEDNKSKNDIIAAQYNYITILLSRMYDDRIINFSKVLDYIENIKSFIVKEYFENDNVDIHKLTSSQLSILTKIPIKNIQDAARTGRLSGIKEGRKWYFDFDIVANEIYGGYNNETK